MFAKEYKPKNRKGAKLKGKMRKLRKEGLSYVRIAEKLGVSDNCIGYWLKHRNYKLGYQKKLYRKGRTWAQLNPKRRRKYWRKYQYFRYHNDLEFRKKMIKSNLRAYKEGISWQQTNRKDYNAYKRKYLKKRRKEGLK